MNQVITKMYSLLQRDNTNGAVSWFYAVVTDIYVSCA